ncbi:hypothetical protein HAX54_018512 [Datura stramonium]|uniref:Uncharacterized protein n=1 Tax=Datura stramonium TaxID=4076 RepID=A0ABS8UPI0_DATST|nr:hypothetical protein [Datura stramonium]
MSSNSPLFIFSDKLLRYLRLAMIGSCLYKLRVYWKQLLYFWGRGKGLMGNRCIATRVLLPARVKWKTNGVEFEDKFRLLSIGSCDMVLGGEWMGAHTPVNFDYEPDILRLKEASKMVASKSDGPRRDATDHNQVHGKTTQVRHYWLISSLWSIRR